MRITRRHLDRLDGAGNKRQVAANRLFEMARDSAPGPRRLRLVRAGYRALRRAMAVDQTISLGAPHPGWKELQAFYRRRLEVACAESKAERAARKALREARRDRARASLESEGRAQASLLDAVIEYARVTGMTLRFW